MNNADRKELARAREMLDNAKGIIEMVAEAETDKFDNMPENLQGSERGEKFEENADALIEIASSIDDIQSEINELQE